MKSLLIISLLLIASCKSTEPVKSTALSQKKVFIETVSCPENGTCTIEILQNNSIEFKSDEFGKIYPEISKGNKTVFKYTYTKSPIPNVADSNYSEIVYAEFDENISAVNLADDELQQVKLYFGRLCFCKDGNGYFPINRGDFKLTKTSKDSIKIELRFAVKKVPQIISEINETVSLKSNETK